MLVRCALKLNAQSVALRDSLTTSRNPPSRASFACVLPLKSKGASWSTWLRIVQLWMPSLLQRPTPSTCSKNAAPPSSPQPSLGRSTCGVWPLRMPHEPTQGDQLRDLSLRASCRPRLALCRRRCCQIRPCTSLFPCGCAGVGAAGPAQGVGGADQEPRGVRRRSATGATAGAVKYPWNFGRPAARGGDDWPAPEASVGTVQTGAGDEPRDSGPLRSQPAPYCAAGALLPAQRKLHRSRALPERSASSDRRAENRLYSVS